jgi:hypothetical protein
MYTEGKGVSLTGHPYVVNSQLGPWANFIREWHQKITADQYVFPTELRVRIHARIYKALKLIDHKYNTRSVRRGAAITMGMANVDLDHIRQFTGHTSVDMLLRYMGWGWFDGATAKRAATHAAHLWPRESTET